MNKIKSVTVVLQGNSISCEVGNTYNGLLLDHISVYQSKAADLNSLRYVGFTESNDVVFEAINTSMFVVYCKEEV